MAERSWSACLTLSWYGLFVERVAKPRPRCGDGERKMEFPDLRVFDDSMNLRGDEADDAPQRSTLIGRNVSRVGISNSKCVVCLTRRSFVEGNLSNPACLSRLSVLQARRDRSYGVRILRDDLPLSVKSWLVSM